VFGHTSRDSRFGANSSNLSCCGLVMGAPLGMAIRGNGERWWGGAYKVVVGGWCCIWLHKQGWQIWGQKVKIEPLGLGFRCAMKGCGGGQWGEVVVHTRWW
jgi:hypothetical protein